MFTGIIDHCGVIAAIARTAQMLRFTITNQFQNMVLGESIAVDGVCLTVTDIQQQAFCCDVSSETMTLTTLSNYVVNSQVNLERALTLGQRMGGHYVTGHVDGTVVVAAVTHLADCMQVQLSGFTAAQARYLIPKGSITVNGVSLTINTVTNLLTPSISLMLIPHTLASTNLSNLVVGSVVNIEFDYYAKAIAYQLALQQQVCEVEHV